VQVRRLGDVPANASKAVFLTADGRGVRGTEKCRVLGQIALPAPTILFLLEPPRRLVLWMARTTADDLGVALDGVGEPARRFFSRVVHPADIDSVLAQFGGYDLPYAVVPMPAGFRMKRKDGSSWAVQNQPALVWRSGTGRIRWLFGLVRDRGGMSGDDPEGRSSRILSGASEAANALLSCGELSRSAPPAIAAVARAIDAESVLVRQFKRDELLGVPFAEARWEWTIPAAGITSSAGRLQALPLDGTMARWLAGLADGLEMSGVSGSLPEPEQKDFEGRGILSALAVPIRVHSTVWGYLELADGRTRRTWTTADLDAARILASHLGHAIERARNDYRLRTLSRAVEQSPSAILIADSTGEILFVNPRFTELSGCSAEEVLGRRATVLASREIAPRLFEKLADAVREGADWRGEIFDETRASGRYWREVRISPTRDTEGRAHYVVTEEDVTVRRRAEEILRGERERYRFLFDAVPALVWRVDGAGACVDVNRTWCDYTGQEAGTAEGDGWLEGFGLEDRIAVRSAVQAALSAPRSFHLESRLRRRDGAEKWHLVAVEPVPGSKAGYEGLLGVCVDLSAVKETERALLASKEELRALTSRLVSVREEERRSLARELHDGVGQALTGLSLELASIDRNVEADRPEVSQRLQLLSKELADTLADVRDLARRIRPAALDVGLVAALEGELKAFGRRSGISWVLHAHEELVIDPERSLALFRFAQEALTNVVRHADARNVSVTLAVRAGAFVLEVVDDGRGVDAAVAGARGGLGLVGLRERVAPWGGSVRLDPNRSGGTRAILEIPSREASPSGSERSR
jgi:PAS domain S-box-containing protein